MKVLKDYVLIELEDRFNRETDVKGVDGKPLVLAVDEQDDYMANQRVKTWGVVVSVPKTLSRVPIMQESSGTPQYVTSGQYKYKYRSDIVLEVKEGDKIYFHHNTLYAENGMKNLVGMDGKKSIYKIGYESIQCAVRERAVQDADGYETVSDIIMIGSHCLIKPDMETWDEILIPTYKISNGVPMVDDKGKKMFNPKEKWLQKRLEPEAKALQGFVVLSGTPLKGDINELKFNDPIYYYKNADWLVNIERKMYYMIKQRHIIAKR